MATSTFLHGIYRVVHVSKYTKYAWIYVTLAIISYKPLISMWRFRETVKNQASSLTKIYGSKRCWWLLLKTTSEKIRLLKERMIE